MFFCCAKRQIRAHGLWLKVNGDGLRDANIHKEVVEFIETNHRNPSKHRIEEYDMLNWMKANRKRLNAGEMKEKMEDSTTVNF